MSLAYDSVRSVRTARLLRSWAKHPLQQQAQRRAFVRLQAAAVHLSQAYEVDITTNPHDLLQVAKLRAQAYYEGDDARFLDAFVKQFESAEWTSLQSRTQPRYGREAACCCLAARALPSDRILATADLLPPYAHSHSHPKGVPQDDEDGAYVLNVVVDRDWRRRGLGREVMTAAIRAARLRQAHRLYTEVDTDNMGALLLYLSMDFVQAGEVSRSLVAPGQHGRRYVLVRTL